LFSAVKQLPCQPLATVEAHLHVEGEPRLETGVHEAEPRVNEVLVQVQALPGPEFQPALLDVPRAVVLEAHARFGRLEETDEARLVERVPQEQISGEVLLARLGRLQVFDGPRELLGLGHRDGLHARARLKDVVPKVEKPDPGEREEVDHPPVGHQRQECAPEHQPIESRQRAADSRFVASYEPLHDVLLWGGPLARTFVPD
jgi:hypothetical protein